MINPLIILFLLGLLQGLIGWIMVKSGLEDSPLLYVSHYKLAIHFILALGIICYALWFALQLLVPKEKIIELCGRVGIGDKLNVKMSSCSYGEQQRVSILRALLQPYDLLLLDEPFSHLDEKNSQQAMELILEETRQREAGIIFADLERIDYFPFTRLFHL